MPRPYKALRRQGYKHHLLPLHGAHVLQILRLFIPKHPCRLSRIIGILNGRGMPRPYKALRRQGYKHYFTALTGRENVGFFPPPEAEVEVKSSRLWRDCRGEACLARRVRRTRIVIIRGIVVIGVRRTRIADIAIIHSQTSLLIISGRGVPRPYKALRRQGYAKKFVFCFSGVLPRRRRGSVERSYSGKVSMCRAITFLSSSMRVR